MFLKILTLPEISKNEFMEIVHSNQQKLDPSFVSEKSIPEENKKAEIEHEKMEKINSS